MRLGVMIGYVAAIAAGICLRLPLAGWSSPDYALFLLPWYEYAHLHGLDALADDFTNYSPFYSYLLITATLFDDIASPLSLIKAISFVFEFGNATMAAILGNICSRNRNCALLAFTLVWIAPTALYNGAAWGQSDSIWTFFLLVAIALFARGRNGAGLFGMAFAVKAQALFLGPFILGVLARGGISRVFWLAAVPIVYLIVAVPVLIAGRSIGDVAMVYARQADYFRSLTMNAGSLWALLPPLPYTEGTIAGLILGICAAIWLAREISKSSRRDPTWLVLAAGASLLLMPFILPKMHDRYFYAFEIVAIILSCIRPRYFVFAAISQIDGVLSYLAYDQNIALGIRLAAIGNASMLYFIILELKSEWSEIRFAVYPWGLYVASIAAVGYFISVAPTDLDGIVWKMGYIVAMIFTAFATAFLLQRNLVPKNIARH